MRGHQHSSDETYDVEPVVDPEASYSLRSPLRFSSFTLDETEVLSSIRETLQMLQGLDVRSLGHQVRMLMIGFGGVTTRPISAGPKKGQMCDESDYHLHVSTGWQILQNDRVIIRNDTEGLYDPDGRPTVESIAMLEDW